MAMAEAKKLIEVLDGKTEIVSMSTYNKGYDAGCRMVGDGLVDELTKVYVDREILGDDYCMGVVDGTVSVLEEVLDSVYTDKDNCAA